MSVNRLVALQPSKQQLIDYANALIVINNYAWAITNQSLPVLNYPPKDYADFATDFGKAKQHTLNWTTNIFVSLIQFPTTITQQAADLFNLEDTFIKAYFDALILNPKDAKSKEGLEKALTILSELINTQVKAVTDAQAQLQQFQKDIEADAIVLTNISKDALKDAGSDQATINQLLADIESLKSQISAANTLLTISEIGIGASLFVGLIGVTCCFIPGCQGVGAGLIIVAVAGEVASIVGTVIENQRIKTLQSSIDSEQKQIKSLDQDIILLKGVSNSFDDLYNANLQAQNSLKTIVKMWDNLASEIAQVKKDLTNVETDNISAQYQQALDAFKEAEKAWQEVVDFATALAGIDYSWQDTSGTWHKYGAQNPAINSGSVTNISSSISAV